MTDDTWEGRMSAKASFRQHVEEELYMARLRQEWEEQNETWIKEYADTLTPESAAIEDKAVRENLVSCACTGGPLCCIVRYKARQRVLGE